VSASRVADRLVNPTRSANSTLTTRRSVVRAGAAARAAGAGSAGAPSGAASLVPQFAQKVAPGTIVAPQLGQPMRLPQRTQNFASAGFSAEQFEQITCRDFTRATADTSGGAPAKDDQR